MKINHDHDRIGGVFAISGQYVDFQSRIRLQLLADGRIRDRQELHHSRNPLNLGQSFFRLRVERRDKSEIAKRNPSDFVLGQPNRYILEGKFSFPHLFRVTLHSSIARRPSPSSLRSSFA
jgi:hypothetical protein